MCVCKNSLKCFKLLFFKYSIYTLKFNFLADFSFSYKIYILQTRKILLDLNLHFFNKTIILLRIFSRNLSVITFNKFVY